MTTVKRDGQRRRTRQAIISAAAGLLRAGHSPSMGEVAVAADVSRRTVYLYFASIEHLLADAALEATRGTVEPRFEPAGTAEERLDGLVRAIQGNAGDSEELGRTIIKHTIDARGMAEDQPRRGYRRVQWIEDALAPTRATMDAATFERLVSALTLLVGWEALFILRDTRGLTPAEAEEVSAWAAQALLAASLPPAPARSA